MTSFPAIGPNPNLTKASFVESFLFWNPAGVKKQLLCRLNANWFQLRYTTSSCQFHAGTVTVSSQVAVAEPVGPAARKPIRSARIAPDQCVAGIHHPVV